jgi:ssDNA-binding Zn-finger/Zn-ribbon topoisomerase 1
MKDNLCDSCKQELEIQRNKKGSRFLVCRNPKCKRGAKNAPPVAAKKVSKPSEEKQQQQPPAPARKSGFSLGW